MKLTLNPFAFVAQQDATYSFLGSGAASMRSFTFDETQLPLFSALCEGEFFEEDALCACFGEDTVRQLREQDWLVGALPDIESMDSRSAAFYRQHGMEAAARQLREKSVLILGCGGIGTHMAWYMILLGVGRVTLVDFDTVEESNLNRQLLFDRGDVGKPKLEVLREKLLRIRPDAEIRTVNLRISSEAELEALCTAAPYDLLIKSLDSPAAFPQWLDHVCRKHRLPYVAGITLQDRVLIGPTFLPGRSEIGWSDVLPVQSSARKIHGLAPSFGPMLCHIAAALAFESFKLLTGIGTLQYPGRIVSENLFTNEREELLPAQAGKPQPGTEAQPDLPMRTLGAQFLVLGLLCVGGFVNPLLFLAPLVCAVFVPVLLCRDRNAAIRLTLIDSLAAGLLFFVRLARSVQAGGAGQLALLLALGFCGVSAVTLVCCGLAALLSGKRRTERA